MLPPWPDPMRGTAPETGRLCGWRKKALGPEEPAWILTGEQYSRADNLLRPESCAVFRRVTNEYGRRPSRRPRSGRASVAYSAGPIAAHSDYGHRHGVIGRTYILHAEELAAIIYNS